MSHQIGLQLIALRFHTIELMNWKRQERPVHAMYKQVPVFQAKQKTEVKPKAH